MNNLHKMMQMYSEHHHLLKHHNTEPMLRLGAQIDAVRQALLEVQTAQQGHVRSVDGLRKEVTEFRRNVESKRRSMLRRGIAASERPTLPSQFLWDTMFTMEAESSEVEGHVEEVEAILSSADFDDTQGGGMTPELLKEILLKQNKAFNRLAGGVIAALHDYVAELRQQVRREHAREVRGGPDEHHAWRQHMMSLESGAFPQRHGDGVHVDGNSWRRAWHGDGVRTYMDPFEADRVAREQARRRREADRKRQMVEEPVPPPADAKAKTTGTTGTSKFGSLGGSKFGSSKLGTTSKFGSSKLGSSSLGGSKFGSSSTSTGSGLGSKFGLNKSATSNTTTTTTTTTGGTSSTPDKPTLTRSKSSGLGLGKSKFTLGGK
jgi:hypothetical protein